jgi:DNA repair exonuclease SbcCD nuclease subunit
MVRFLHVADLHLGLQFTCFGARVNGSLREARIESLRRVVEKAKAGAVDFMLVAGDLFDDNHVDAATSRRALELFESLGRPVFVIPGNHDPLTADSVFNRPPWSSPREHVHVLRTREPVPIAEGVLLPCPVFAKNSLQDPTSWIPPRNVGDTDIRIGLAHGSLNDRATLSPDDHVIDRHATDEKGLDYLALGHWHKPSIHKDRAGVERIAYPGLHEPKEFHDAPDYATGWSPYSNVTQTGLFAGDGKGRALLVMIDRAGTAPRIEEIETGGLHWCAETRTLNDGEDLDRLINELDHRPNKGSQLLHLRLCGTLPAQEMLRLDALDATLGGGQGGILTLFFWFALDMKGLYAQPTDAETQDLVGNGVLRAVYERLKAEADGPDVPAQELARQSLLLLYRFAKETRR